MEVQKRRTFSELKPGEDFQSAAESHPGSCVVCDVAETRSTTRSAAPPGGGAAPCMRREGNQSIATATPRPWEEQRDSLVQAGKEGLGGGGVM